MIAYLLKYCKNTNSKQAAIHIFIAFFFIATSLSTIYLSALKCQHYSLLAHSFINGKLSLAEYPVFGQKLSAVDDLVFRNGHYYTPHGPFPAVLLMPFVYTFEKFHLFFYHNYLSPAIVIFIFIACFLLYKKLKYSKEDALYLAFAFCFATMFLGVCLVNPTPGYFAHIVTVLLISLSLLEYYGKKRYWLIGSCVGLAALTRLTAGGGILFFVLAALFLDKEDKRKKLINLVRLLAPFTILILVLFMYNYACFGNFPEGGYSAQLVNRESLRVAKNYGLMSIKHLPGNLYYAFISGPLPVFKDNVSHILAYPFIEANPWGMSIFITSPCLFYLFFLKHKDKTSLFLLSTCVLIAIPIFLYYGIGYIQFGYRYGLDFLPFLFFLFARNYREKYKKLSINLKILIIVSACANLYLWMNWLHYIADG